MDSAVRAERPRRMHSVRAASDNSYIRKEDPMTHNLRSLGFVVMATLVLGATWASSASATTGHLTSPNGAVEVRGTATDQTHSWTLFGNEIRCHAAYTLEKTGTTAGELLKLPATSATVTATYTKCTQGTEPSTFTMNGCSYDFTFTNGRVALVCPTGKVLELHRYGSVPHGSSTCTTTVKPTTEVNVSHAHTVVHTTDEYGTVTYTNVADGDIEVHGTVEGITAQSHGACSFGLTINTSEAILHVGAVFAVEDATQSPVPVHVG